MINADMRIYNCFRNTGGWGNSFEWPPVKTVKMSVNVADIDTQNNSVWNAEYVGLTMDKTLDNELYIDIGKQYLAEVTSIYQKGRYTQVFLRMSGNVVPEQPEI